MYILYVLFSRLAIRNKHCFHARFFLAGNLGFSSYCTREDIFFRVLMPKQGSKYKSLSEKERVAFGNLLFSSFDGITLRHGALREIAVQFLVDPTTISAIWKRARASIQNGHITSPGIFSRKKKLW